MKKIFVLIDQSGPGNEFAGAKRTLKGARNVWKKLPKARQDYTRIFELAKGAMWTAASTLDDECLPTLEHPAVGVKKQKKGKGE